MVDFIKPGNMGGARWRKGAKRGKMQRKEAEVKYIINQTSHFLEILIIIMFI